MQNERTRRPSRDVATAAAGIPQSEEADPFKDIGQVARDARKPTSERFGEEAPEPPADDPPDEQEKPLDERAAQVIDAATIAIVDNIGALISRAERLKQSIMADTAQVKVRMSANLNHGGRILELSRRMNTELDELENIHRQQIRGEQ